MESTNEQNRTDPTLNKADVRRSFSRYDMKGAWEAGQKLIDHEWHMQEFHGFSCKCKEPEYKDFDDWFDKNCA